MQSEPPNPGLPRIDTHVHLVGNGSGGSGCWLRRVWWRQPFYAWLIRSLGLPVSALRGELERLYVERLLHCVRTSSLNAVVILAQDDVYDEEGRRMEEIGAFYVPNDYALRLAREHPEFRAGVSIHPARPDAMEELEKCLAQGAALMKCLPNCHNIDCNNRRYTRFWERMAAAGLPLLAHTGGEFTLPVVNPALADPRRLTLPLECGVTVIAAHCATRSGLADPQYFPVFTEMIQRYPRLYGDNSAFLVPNNRCRGEVLPACLRPPVGDRIVHGSDYPVGVFGLWAWLRGRLTWTDFWRWQRHPIWAWLRGRLTWTDFWRWQRHPNPIERDYQFKQAIGFAPETFTRVNRLLRPTVAS